MCDRLDFNAECDLRSERERFMSLCEQGNRPGECADGWAASRQRGL